MRLRGGTAPPGLRVDDGKGCLGRRGRQGCHLGEVEEVAHWLFECDKWGTEHQPLLLSLRARSTCQ